MSHTYLIALQRLLPQGHAWTREAQANLTLLFEAIAATLSRCHEQVDRLRAESVPSSAAETLVHWERVLDVPGRCGEVLDSNAGRRDAIVLKLTSAGGQSKAYFETMARLYDRDAAVREFRPTVCALAKCGDQLGGPHSVRRVWQIVFGQQAVRHARAGLARCADPLSEFERHSQAECLLTQAAPAHTHLVFNYTGAPA